jgi:DUF4097 and DUF4098 domain-containing protein YvlB
MVEKRGMVPGFLVGVAVIVGGAIGLAQPSTQQASPVTVPFSDPGRPGTVRVALTNGIGGLTIHGENRKDVSIESESRDAQRQRERERPDGLRLLTPAAGFQVTEENNEMTISAGRASLDIHVPTKTTLRVNSTNSGAVTIDAIDGEIEVNATNSSVTLTNIRGSVVANSTNGKVTATFAAITPGKAMAFTSMNGPIDVTIPASTKANLKMQTERGDVYSDFDVQLQPSAPPKADATQRRNGRLQLEVNRALSGTINGGGPEFELRTFNANIYLRKAK